MQMLGLSVRPWNERKHPSKQFPVQLFILHIAQECAKGAPGMNFHKVREPKYSWKAVVCCNCLAFSWGLFLCGENVTLGFKTREKEAVL